MFTACTAILAAAKNPAHAAKTNQLFHAIQLEISAQPKGPTLIVGDVNADIDCIPVLHNLVTAGHFIDVGAHADAFGQAPNQPTCMARNSTKPTRRDFVFSSPDLFPAFKQFQVVRADVTPVHATILFQLKWDLLPHSTLVAHKPASLGERLYQHIDGILGPELITKGVFDEASFPGQQATKSDSKIAADVQKEVLGLSLLLTLLNS